ncbi:MAG: hypothetical protein ACRCXD_14510 [Luteolibacter sp.]
MKRSLVLFLILAAVLVVGRVVLKWPVGSEDQASPQLVSPALPSSDVLSATFDALRERPGPDSAGRSLLELKEKLRAMPAGQATTLIRGFLGSGRDFPTGLAFDIAEDGSLTTWPTFRCFLLDVLPVIDGSAAAAVGREILAMQTSADEWALALRNVARGGSLAENVDFLQSKTEELIANPAWQAKPSIGYLNSFDVIVHVEAVGSAPLLSELVRRKDRQDLAHAGFITLDRLVLRKPVETLTLLANDRELIEVRPEAVAQQFARADVRETEQREILKAWLLDPGRTPVELDSFANIYPNSNRFVSNNLLSKDVPPSGVDLAQHDQAALQVFSAWKSDATFEPVRGYLEKSISRLEGFVHGRKTPASPAPGE